MISLRNSTIMLWGCALLWAGVVQAELLGQVSEDLQDRLGYGYVAKGLSADHATFHSPELIGEFYARRAYRPAWSDQTGPLPLADALLKAVSEAGAEGLRPADYHSSEISLTLILLRNAYAPTAGQVADLELLLTDAFLTYGSHLLAGRSPVRLIEDRSEMQSRSRDLVAVLQDALAGGDIAGVLETLKPSYPGYARLREALAYYQSLEQRGGWPTVSWVSKLTLGSHGPQVKELRARLRVTGELADAIEQRGGDGEGHLLRVADSVRQGAVAESAGRDEIFGEVLAEAVRRFQQRHGLIPDGIVGPRTLAALNVPVSQRVRQIELNLERLRWLPEDLGERHILVNITDFGVSVVEKGREVMQTRAVVGKAKRPTPVFSGTMSYLVLSPRWHVPRSIAVKDKLPKLRQDAYALSKQGMRIYDAAGEEIDPGTVDWETVDRSNFAYRFRQDPGPANALGRIKFMFPNRHNVYLHDTPQTYLFTRAERTFSSGCVRVSEPFELAEYLLRGDPRWNRDKIVAASRGRRERYVTLPEKIPVHLLYWTAWVEDDGAVNFRNDIYDRDQVLAKALFAA